MSINSINLSAQNSYKQNDIKPQKSKTLEDELNPVEQTVVNSVAPARRIIGIPDMLKNGDTLAACALGALTIISLPEDCRDLKAAYNHSACVLNKKRLSTPYNYRKFQHDFSFIRGTLLHEALKKVKSAKGKIWVEKMYNLDKTLYNTGFGKWVQKLLGLSNGKKVKSKIKNLSGQEIFVQEIVAKKDFLGLKELTGRALKRTTLLGLGFTALLEFPKIVKSLKKGDSKSEKLKSFASQTAKSTLNTLSIAAGMGYIGAIGAKKFGALGSLLGMGLGAIAGAGVSKGIEQNLSK